MTDEVSLSRFSFQIPKPLQKNYVRKRPVRPAFHNDAGDPGTQQYLPSSEGVRQPARKNIIHISRKVVMLSNESVELICSVTVAF